MSVENDGDVEMMTGAADFGRSGSITPTGGVATPVDVLFREPFEAVAGVEGVDAADASPEALIATHVLPASAEGAQLRLYAVGRKPAQVFRILSVRPEGDGALTRLELGTSDT